MTGVPKLRVPMSHPTSPSTRTRLIRTGNRSAPIRWPRRAATVLLSVVLLLATLPARGAWPEAGPDDLRISFTGDDANESFRAGQPRAAYDAASGEFFVVWAATTVWGGNVTRSEIFGQRVSAQTGERVGAVIAISVPDAGSASYSSDMPDVVFNPIDNRFLVAWHRNDDNTGAYRALGRFIDAASAQPLGAINLTLVVAGNSNGNNMFDEDRIRLAYSPAAGRYYLVWTSTPSPASTDAAISRVHGISINAEGQPTGPQSEFTANIGLGFPAAADTSPSVVYNDATHEFLVTWLGLGYWYVNERDATKVFAQRVNATTGEALPAPVEVSAGAFSADTGRPMYPDVVYVPAAQGYLAVWMGTAPFTYAAAPLYLKWLPQDLANRLPAPFLVRPQKETCVGAQPGLGHASGDTRVLLTWSSGPGGSMTGTSCAGGTQVFGLLIGPGQSSGFSAPIQLSQMGPAGGTTYRAFRPAVVTAPDRRRALTVWYGNDELPGVAANKSEVFGQMVDLTQIALLPATLNGYRPAFTNREVEPNNSGAEANGPVQSGVAIAGYANDTSDYYRLTVSIAGTLSAAVLNPQGQGTQLQVYRDPVSTGTLVQSDGVPPYAINATVTPGVYYVRVYTAGGFTSAAPYTLQVTFP